MVVKRFRVFYYVDAMVNDDEDVEKDVKPQIIADIQEATSNYKPNTSHEIVTKLGFDVAEVPLS